MNFRLKGGISVILMSLRPGAPYSDRIEENGRILIYEGHDISQSKNGPNPKTVDQPFRNPGGSLTQNGLFFKAAQAAKIGTKEQEVVKAYEIIKSGIWVYNGFFKLTDAWEEISSNRKVFKFKLQIIDEILVVKNGKDLELDHKRLIPTWVKLEVWRRDKGRCVVCGCEDNLHFDHVIPYTKGGSSLVPQNIQLLCARIKVARDRGIPLILTRADTFQVMERLENAKPALTLKDDFKVLRFLQLIDAVNGGSRWVEDLL